jgi:hypothetical protein
MTDKGGSSSSVRSVFENPSSPISSGTLIFFALKILRQLVVNLSANAKIASGFVFFGLKIH